ncbi:MAG TPA: di-heme oxidoredictase family protein, partial [Thermoanaerobaculia bacterium]|nr:di-heme oxidoredictase family protein [Thermoanaerobaculia bacterium]
GPIFNDFSCANCHSLPAVGGGSTRVETRFGTLTPSGQFDPLTQYGGSLIQSQGIGFADFMTLLAPPPRGPITVAAILGEHQFSRIGCASCHTPTLITGPSPVTALHYVAFHPYSDFLLHDMGSLGDGITQNRATGRLMRTAPLWGVRKETSLLHDGRSATLEQAIAAHDGQGKKARDRFLKLSAFERSQLIAFLNSL